MLKPATPFLSPGLSLVSGLLFEDIESWASREQCCRDRELTHVEERSAVQSRVSNLPRGRLLFQVVSHFNLIAYKLRWKDGIGGTEDVGHVFAGTEEFDACFDGGVD